MDTMLLHAISLEFVHPVGGQLTEITAPLQNELERMIGALGLVF